jgi:hypothetical protein
LNESDSMTLMSLFRREDAVSTTTLRHNPLNAVTATVERLADATGRTVIYKELRQPTGMDDAWAASADPRHWNYWRRELEVYQDASLRQQLQGTGLALPEAEVVEQPDGGASMYLEDIAGRPGLDFNLSEH